MEDLDKYQFRKELVRRGGSREIESLNVTDRNTVRSDESARTKHFLSVYTDEEKKWFVKTDKQESDKGRGFMNRIKEKQDAKQPNRNNMSTQYLRNDAVGFRLEMNEPNTTKEIQQEMMDQNLNTNNANPAKTNNKWTNEMKLELLKIDREKRSKWRGFMKRMKERWNEKYSGLPVTVQCLRDKRCKNKSGQSTIETIGNARP